ncbi:TIM barrel protein [Gulosibacter chungangensis]|uniref:TIM barrel protein n=1 Tax=Gulosibacter chungangensis TaxID=979746 RepID=A0A7J5BCR0_9MICO|nr:TIM barrel protein [Gulosibacter chungangensis]KAB1643399.1 TIM barrel protein [Gulosibacter chungangensis]
MTFTLAANAEMLFLDRPFVDRVSRIHELGFEVEIWDWTAKDLDALVATGASFSSMTGYVSGELIDPEGAETFLESAARSLEAAERLDCPRLNVHGTGLDSAGLPVRPTWHTEGDDWLAAVDTLRKLAELGERAGRVFTIENLNTRVDHPGTPFARSEDTARLVQAVNSPALRMNFDIYHAQIDEGNLIERTIRYLPLIGEIQVADVPGRKEPGTGEINYPAIARGLAEAGYTGTIALEAWASGESTAALTRFRESFALP